MPAADIQQRRAGLPLVPGLLWAGVGLAPVAALLVLLGGDNPNLLRFAVLLAVIAVALIGTSLALRRDSDSIRDEFEDVLFEELDILRDDVREDITTAARATHKAFGERVGTLQESVDSLRGQVEHLRVRVERRGSPSQRVAPPVPPMTAPPPPVGSAPSVVPPVVAPHGLVRHTETVKVTRQTIVDQNDGGRGPGTVYGSNHVAQEPAVPTQRRPERSAAQPGADSGESWSERLLRQRLAEERPRGGDRHDAARYGENGYGDDRSGSHGWSGERHGGWRAPEPDSDPSGFISGVHAGDRWASARSDDRGRELRMGERRTAMHTDESGAEIRVEDRWAAVRRDEVRRAEAHREPERPWERGRDSESSWSREAQRDREAGRGGPGRPEGSWSQARPGESRGEQAGSRGEPRPGWSGTRPALPATPSEPSASTWMQGWDAHPEPANERVRPRQSDDGGYRRNGRDEEAGPARSPRATGYDTGEERWR